VKPSKSPAKQKTKQEERERETKRSRKNGRRKKAKFCLLGMLNLESYIFLKMFSGDHNIWPKRGKII